MNWFKIGLKVGPWAIAALLFALLTVERFRYDAAVQRAAAVEAQCQAEAATLTAKVNEATAAAQSRAQAAADAAEASLAEARRQAAQQAAEEQSAVSASLANIQQESQLPGQDGPIPPILAKEFP